MTDREKREMALDLWIWAEPDREDLLWSEYLVECADRPRRDQRELEFLDFAAERYRHYQRARLRFFRETMRLGVELPPLRRALPCFPARTVARPPRRPRERRSARAAASSRAGPGASEGPEPPRRWGWGGEGDGASAGGAS